MILFGSGAKTMDPVVLEGTECPSCGQPAIIMQLLHRYFHMWWIPIFPIGKVAVTTCNACGTTWEGKETPNQIREEVEFEKKNSSPPKTLFAGLYIVGILIAIGSFVSWQNDRNTGTYITDPHVADFYVMSTDIDAGYPHQLLQITRIDGDSVTMMIGGYGYKNASDATNAIDEQVVTESEYFTDSVKLTKSELQGLYQVEKVVQIIREE